jgi:hypothetical protein
MNDDMSLPDELPHDLRLAGIIAREMLLRVAKEAVSEYLVEAQTSWKTVGDNDQSANPRVGNHRRTRRKCRIVVVYVRSVRPREYWESGDRRIEE